MPSSSTPPASSFAHGQSTSVRCRPRREGSGMGGRRGFKTKNTKIQHEDHEDTKTKAVGTIGFDARREAPPTRSCAAVHESRDRFSAIRAQPRVTGYWACYAGPRAETDRRLSTAVCCVHEAFFMCVRISASCFAAMSSSSCVLRVFVSSWLHFRIHQRECVSAFSSHCKLLPFTVW